ncbi:DUF3592 domain-containing protein [Jannaschia sp. R86511]|uniref:DUF3592 domain-containing protein n=1 Tax=Jannaschia sp. R86511 TaxID=3093853 RepID=UPI0036D276B0
MDLLGGLAVAGAVVAGLAGFDLYETTQLQEHGQETTAVVTDIHHGKSSWLTARYEAEGRTWESDTGRFTDEEIGEEIVVLYDRTDPDRFQTSTWTDWSGDYAFGFTMLSAGVLALAVAAGGSLVGSRPSRRRPRTSR